MNLLIHLMAQEFNTLSLMIHWVTFVSLIVLMRANWRGGITKKYIHYLNIN